MNFEEFVKMTEEVRGEEKSNLVEKIKTNSSAGQSTITQNEMRSIAALEGIYPTEGIALTKGVTTENVIRASLDKKGRYEPPYMLPIVDLSISARPSEDSIESVKAELSKFCEKMGV